MVTITADKIEYMPGNYLLTAQKPSVYVKVDKGNLCFTFHDNCLLIQHTYEGDDGEISMEISKSYSDIREEIDEI